MTKYQPGEQLHDLHTMQQWRKGGYVPFVPAATRADAIAIDAAIEKEFPEWTTQAAYPRLTALALARMDAIEKAATRKIPE